MALVTIREIVDDALAVVGEASGAGVQTYSEDRMMKDAIKAFNTIFKKYYWPQYTDWFTVTCDGTTGIPNADWAENVRDIEDIIQIYKSGTEHVIAPLPNKRNPNAMTSGTDALFWKALPTSDVQYPNRRIKFYPISATTSLDIFAKVYPVQVNENLDWEDKLDLDKDMLVAGTAFLTLSSDDLNPGAADAQRNMMEQRYKDIIGSFATQPIRVSGNGSIIPDQWFIAR